MLRTILSVGAITLLGLFLLKLTFGVLGGLFGLLFWLLAIAIRIALVGLVVYVVIRIVSPDTARRLRERFSGQG
jgi:uncharacterized BrkB/YihY/UPF0761 family membrane protein